MSPLRKAFVSVSVLSREELPDLSRVVSRSGSARGRALLLVLLHGMSFTAAEIISLINSMINIIIFIVTIAIITVVDVSLSVN